MKPQDLRIGNDVRIKDCDKIHYISAINAIDGTIGLDVYTSESNGLTYPIGYSIDKIEPVLIREVYNSLPYIEALEWNDSIDSSNLYEYNFVPIKYLHQLQNIHYAFTGDEIEIEI